MTGHTPTPWVYEPYYRSGTLLPEGQIVSTHGDNDVVLATFTGDTTAGQAIADADYIVRTVNAHEDLVDALEMLLQAYSLDNDYGDPANAMRVRLAAKEQARAALAKAAR